MMHTKQLPDDLFDVLYAADNTFEHDWRTGDLVVWDNLATQHARESVIRQGPERSLRKVIAPKPYATLRASVELPTFNRRSATG